MAYLLMSVSSGLVGAASCLLVSASICLVHQCYGDTCYGDTWQDTCPCTHLVDSSVVLMVASISSRGACLPCSAVISSLNPAIVSENQVKMHLRR